MAPAPDDAFIARGHDPPGDAPSLAPAGSLAPPDAGLGASDGPGTAHKPII